MSHDQTANKKFSTIPEAEVEVNRILTQSPPGVRSALQCFSTHDIATISLGAWVSDIIDTLYENMHNINSICNENTHISTQTLAIVLARSTVETMVTKLGVLKSFVKKDLSATQWVLEEYGPYFRYKAPSTTEAVLTVLTSYYEIISACSIRKVAVEGALTSVDTVRYKGFVKKLVPIFSDALYNLLKSLPKIAADSVKLANLDQIKHDLGLKYSLQVGASVEQGATTSSSNNIFAGIEQASQGAQQRVNSMSGLSTVPKRNADAMERDDHAADLRDIKTNKLMIIVNARDFANEEIIYYSEQIQAWQAILSKAQTTQAAYCVKLVNDAQ